MAVIRVRVAVETVYPLDPEMYRDAWESYCDDEGTVEEGNDYPEVSEEFALQQFQENLESGDEDLGLIMESASIDVKKV